MLNNKKIIFVGPLGNPSEKYLNGFHYVIRSNGFFGINKKILDCDRCDILAVNRIYSVTHSHVIIDNLSKIKYVWTTNAGYKLLREKAPDNQKHKILLMKFKKDGHGYAVKKYPLMLSRILYHILEYYKPALFCVTGIDFYKSKEIKKFWMPGYAIKDCLKSNKLATGKGKHDIESNKILLKYLMEKHKWIKPDKSIRAIIKNIEINCVVHN